MPAALILAAADIHPDVAVLLTGDADPATVASFDFRVSLLSPPSRAFRTGDLARKAGYPIDESAG